MAVSRVRLLCNVTRQSRDLHATAASVVEGSYYEPVTAHSANNTLLGKYGRTKRLQSTNNNQPSVSVPCCSCCWRQGSSSGWRSLWRVPVHTGTKYRSTYQQLLP